MQTKTALIVVLAFALSLPAPAQFAARPDQPAKTAQSLTLADLTAAAQRYFRDSAELPMLQTTTFTVTDAAGHSGKPRTITTTYVFHGYSRGRQTATANITAKESMWAALRGSKMMRIAMNGAVWTIVPGTRLYSEQGDYSLETRDDGSDGLIFAKLIPAKPCSAFTMKNLPHSYVPDQTCGDGEFQVDKNLVVQRFAYDAPGLPTSLNIDSLGKCSLRRYHVDLDFQSVNLPDDSDAFVVPKQVTATLETDRGTIVISSLYRPRQDAAK